MLDESIIEGAMRRALEIAKRGPADNPNPQVGSVILDPEGAIVAEGWHLGSGTPHAEVAALRRLPEGWRARASELTAVVTLEPCNHTGRTGPCAVAIAEAGIGRVVFATTDPGGASSAGASAGGAATLRAAGVEVASGPLEREARELIAGWLARQHAADAPQQPAPELFTADGRPRPRVIVKWAQTLDGRAAAADGSSQWITGPEARADVHVRRAAADVILVGTGTLLADDPSLTARTPDGELLVPAAEQPVPVVLGTREVPTEARVRAHPALAARGLSAPPQLRGRDLSGDLAALWNAGYRSVFVEGGPTVASALIAAGLADDALVYVAPALLGGPRLALQDIDIESIAGIKRLKLRGITMLGEDLLFEAGIAAAAPDVPTNIPTEGAPMSTTEPQITVQARTTLPTEHGEFHTVAYRDERTGVDHLALVGKLPDGSMPGPGALVRVHSECITGEAFGSLKCECGPQLQAAMDLVHEQGGVVIYLRGQEGRGIGLANKLRAYQLQEQGVDTLDANLQLGLPADARDYTAAAEILADLGITDVRLLTNNPDKVKQLGEHGIVVAERVPLVVGVNEVNIGYLRAKRDRMQHQLPGDIAE